MMLLIVGTVVMICSIIGLVLQIQNIKERWELEDKQQIK